MPTNYINSLSKEHKIPVKKLEDIWEKAKQASSNKNNYGIITTIFKSMINKQFDLNENKKEVNLFITNKTMYMEEKIIQYKVSMKKDLNNSSEDRTYFNILANDKLIGTLKVGKKSFSSSGSRLANKTRIESYVSLNSELSDLLKIKKIINSKFSFNYIGKINVLFLINHLNELSKDNKSKIEFIK